MAGKSKDIVGKKKGSKFFWFDFYVDGKRRRGSTKQETIGKAREFAALKMVQFSTNAGVPKKAVVLRDFAPSFLVFVEASRLAVKTKEYYRNGWRLLSRQPISGMKMQDISPADAAVISIPGSGSNVNTALRTLRRLLSLAEEKQLIAKVPRIALVEEHERTALVDASIDTLIMTKAIPTVQHLYVLVADCGIRPADASALRWEDVYFGRGDIFIQGGKTGRKAQRYVSMTSRVREAMILRAALSAEWVFASERNPGHPMTPRVLSSMFCAFKRKFGIPKDVVLYSARHTFATDLTEATGNLVKTQKALGHTSLSTTARYNHSRSADVATIMNVRNAERHDSLWQGLSPQ
jgi:integrase